MSVFKKTAPVFAAIDLRKNSLIEMTVSRYTMHRYKMPYMPVTEAMTPRTTKTNIVPIIVSLLTFTVNITF